MMGFSTFGPISVHRAQICEGGGGGQIWGNSKEGGRGCQACSSRRSTLSDERIWSMPTKLLQNNEGLVQHGMEQHGMERPLIHPCSSREMRGMCRLT